MNRYEFDFHHGRLKYSVRRIKVDEEHKKTRNCD
jgi:hypothetical protein